MRILTIYNKDILHQVQLSGKTLPIIEEIICRKIIIETASETEITIGNDRLQKAADEFRLSHQLHNAKDTWEWLSKQNLSLDDFEEMLNYSLIVSELNQHLFKDKIEPYFVEHQVDYMGAVMYEIILDDEDLAMELYLAIQDKEISFYEVAHQYIKEPELRRKGGYRGVLNRQDLKPEISAAVFAANPPQLLKPITTSKGTSLILVEEIIKPELTEELAAQISLNLFDRWLKEKVKEIEYELVDETQQR
jgi:hypothetical protein